MREADRRDHAGDPGREPPAGRLVLAAVERAAGDGPDVEPAVALRSILEHLALAPRSAAARSVRLRLAELERDGSLSAARRHSVAVWALTDTGRRRLRRDTGALDGLPESPQHRAWRSARLAAAQELDRFAADLGGILEQAGALLAEGPATAGSDAWLLLGEELRHACRRLGSAVHCLREWPEPAEERADVDPREELPLSAGLDSLALARLPALRGGRRNTGLWQAGPFG
jgi:hypothetical protein